MLVQEHRSGAVLVIALHGKLDNETGPAVETKFDRFVEKGEPLIVLDCAKLEFLSSRGLGVLIRMHNRQSAKENRLILVNLTERLQHIIGISGLDRKFDIRPTLADALDEAPGGE